MLAWEGSVHPIGLFARGGLFFAMWRRMATSRDSIGAAGLRVFVPSGLSVASRSTASSRVLAHFFASPLTWRLTSSHDLLGPWRRFTTSFREEFHLDSVFSAIEVLNRADVIVVVMSVGAVVDSAVSEVMQHVISSESGGSQARLLILDNPPPLAGRSGGSQSRL